MIWVPVLLLLMWAPLPADGAYAPQTSGVAGRLFGGRSSSCRHLPRRTASLIPRAPAASVAGTISSSQKRNAISPAAEAAAAVGWIDPILAKFSGAMPSGASVVAAILTLAGYHLNLIRQERSDTVKTWRVFQADTREEWARYVRKTEGWLYAVQTLRNAITAQTFLATTVLSLLTLITGRVWDILRNTASGSDRRLLTVQLVSIASTMLLSAYNFLQGVRFMTHAGFMFPVVSRGTKVDKIMRQSQNCQWLGLRWMYVSLGPIAWVVGGGRAFFGTAMVLLQFFRSIDRKPKGMGYEEFQGDAI